MKKIILLMCLSFSAVSQIKVIEPVKDFNIGTVKQSGTKIASLDYSVRGSDTVYFFMFKNQKYQMITDFVVIMFKGQETLNDLKSLMLGSFQSTSKIEFKLGKEYVILTKEGKQCYFWTDKGYILLSEKEVNKLFGI